MGLDLRPDTSSLSPTQMRRGDVIDVDFTFPNGYVSSIAEWLCQVRRKAGAAVEATWALSAAGDVVTITMDASDLEGFYVWDLQDHNERTLFGAVLIVDLDVSEA